MQLFIYREYQNDVDMILVCEICKGNHELGSGNCPGYDVNQRTICFRGPQCVMSNMYPCTVPFRNKQFPSSEHAYQWEKAMTVGDFSAAQQILEAPDGFTAKKISQRMDKQCLDIWRQHYSVRVMKKIAQAKFENVEEFREELIDSKGMFLIETTSDTFWGVGFLQDVAAYCRPQYWPGENVMGRILMELRDKYLGLTEEFLPYDEVSCAIARETSSPRVDPLVVQNFDL